MALEKNQDFLNAFGKRVKALRLEKGFSMRALADVLNIDKNQLSRIEEAQINTSIMMAYALAGAFGMEVWELLRFDGEGQTGLNRTAKEDCEWKFVTKTQLYLHF